VYKHMYMSFSTEYTDVYVHIRKMSRIPTSHTHMYTHTHTHTHVICKQILSLKNTIHMHVCMCVSVCDCLCIYVCVLVCVHIYVYRCIHAYVCTYTCVDVYMYMHVRVCAYILQMDIQVDLDRKDRE